MPYGGLEHFLARTVIDRQRDVYVRYLHIAHNPVAGDVQQGVIVLHVLLVGQEPVFVLEQPRVVRSRLGEHLFVPVRVQLRHRVHIGGYGPRLVPGVPVVRDSRVQQ